MYYWLKENEDVYVISDDSDDVFIINDGKAFLQKMVKHQLIRFKPNLELIKVSTSPLDQEESDCFIPLTHSKLEWIQWKIKHKGVIFLKDIYLEVAIKAELSDGVLKAFIKHKNSSEIEVPQSNDTFCQVLLGGEEIIMSEYDSF